MSADLETAYRMALTGKGSPLLSSKEVAVLAGLAQCKGDLIETVEAYRLKDGLEIPCIQYGLYAPHVADMVGELPWERQIEFAQEELKAILEETRGERDEFGFKVWLSSREEV